MAVNYGTKSGKMLSYVTIQRRVRALNTTLGTKYNAKKIMEQQARAEKFGYMTEEYRAIMATKGIRADVSYAKNIQAQQEAARYFLRQQFGNLAEKQKNVDLLLRGKPGDIIAPNGDVWTKETAQDGSTKWVNTRTREELQNQPAGEPYSPSAAYDKIKKVVEKMKEQGMRNPDNFYNEIDALDE